jgi:arsenate reductase
LIIIRKRAGIASPSHLQEDYCEFFAVTLMQIKALAESWLFRDVAIALRRTPIGEAGELAMKATIWHNPGCGTSRNTLAMLVEADATVTVVEYLKAPPSAQKLAQLYRDAGMTPQQGLRLRGTDAEERGLPTADDATVLAAMAAEPKLIERPLVETDKGVRLCRPKEKVLEII